jgi:hypothetical protein
MFSYINPSVAMYFLSYFPLLNPSIPRQFYLQSATVLVRTCELTRLPGIKDLPKMIMFCDWLSETNQKQK